MKYLVIDFSNLAYTSLFKSLGEDGLKIEEVPKNYTNFYWTFENKLEQILEKIGRDHIKVFALDHRPKHKLAMSRDYKLTRKPLAFNPKPYLMNMIKLKQCLTIEAEDYEADDVIASFVYKYSNQDFVVTTTDKDLWLLRALPHVKIFDHYGSKFISESDLDNKFRLSRWEHIYLYKILWGDVSDGIKNIVPRMQKQLLPIIAKTNGSLDDFLHLIHAHKDIISKRCFELVNDNIEGLRLNEELVKLKWDCEIITKAYPNQ